MARAAAATRSAKRDALAKVLDTTQLRPLVCVCVSVCLCVCVCVCVCAEERRARFRCL